MPVSLSASVSALRIAQTIALMILVGRDLLAGAMLPLLSKLAHSKRALLGEDKSGRIGQGHSSETIFGMLNGFALDKDSIFLYLPLSL